MHTDLIINGQQIQGQGLSFAVINPANESVIAEVASVSAGQVNDAVHTALQAFKAWKNVSDDAVKQAFAKIAADIRAEKDEIALFWYYMLT